METSMPTTITEQASGGIGDASADDARWAAICARTALADDPFVYAVKSTGVYCRAGCASRRPHRANVAFHPNAASAAAAGYRACLRCRPDQPTTAPDALSWAIAQACRRIEQAQTPPPLAMLAAQAGVSPFHFQRKFKAAVGVSPAAYGRAKRAERARNALQSAADVTSAIYEAGFISSGSPLLARAGPCGRDGARRLRDCPGR
jgi:AraC family transcriptional regulator of adaptative response/methylated-DNA-[protein]-cysteine methyltransferase